MASQQGKSQFSVAILGASGFVGRSTLQYFNNNPIRGVRVTGFVREFTNDFSAQMFPNLELKQGDMSDESSTALSLRGFDSVYLVTPGDENRNRITDCALRAAKTAGVKHLLVVSAPTVRGDQVHGLQFSGVEDSVKQCGIPYTILRLALFMDDNLVHASTIKTQSTVFFPIDPSIPYVAIALADVAEASVKILVDPKAHANRTYVLASRLFTITDLVTAISNLLGRQIQYVRVSYEETQQLLLSSGLKQAQADGILEMLQAIDKKDPVMMTPTGDFKNITGREPLTIQQWAQLASSSFM